MPQPEDWTIRIAPDGRITLEANGVTTTSWRRIVQMLEETVGPVAEVPLSPEDPPRRFLHAADELPRRQELKGGQGSGS